MVLSQSRIIGNVGCSFFTQVCIYCVTFHPFIDKTLKYPLLLDLKFQFWTSVPR